MSLAGQVNVERAIVHVINHLQEKEPIASDYEIPLAARPKLREYFEGQVENAVNSSGAFPAHFDPAVTDGTPAACYRMIEEPEEHFVRASQELAAELFEVSQGNSSIAVGTLLCCLCVATEVSDARFLALIKIDLTEVLIQEVEKDSEGHTTVTFSVHDDALPTLGERLLKAALVPPRSADPTKPRELKLLDYQSRDEPAEFFARKFLHAAPILNRERETKLLYRCLKSALKALSKPKKHEPRLTPEEVDQLDQHFDTWFHQKKVDLTDDLANLRISEDPERDKKAKEVIEEKLDERLAGRMVDIDPEVASKLVKKARFTGDLGVATEFDAAHSDEIYELVDEWEDGEDHFSVVQLTVRNLKWISPLPTAQDEPQ